MHRCIQLARKGAGSIAPNPMVGAVLVYEDRIIGEGWHQQYGEAHAEVNCLHAVQEEDKHLVPLSTLYVSLEPCAHFGKTPPCSDLIIKHRIPKVVIGCKDPFAEVDGKGIEKLKAAGVETVIDVLKEECIDLNKRFFTFHQQHRPYIILKWAQTANQKIASTTEERLLISNEMTNRLVHQWRSEEDAILVGTNTALMDDPQLTNRYWPGKQPIRLVLDKELRLPTTLQLFNANAKTIVFNTVKHVQEDHVQYYQLNKEENIIQQIIDALYQLNIQSILVEGGAQLLQSFIDEGLWDEVRKIENGKLNMANGLEAPKLKQAEKISELHIMTDRVEFYKQIR